MRDREDIQLISDAKFKALEDFINEVTDGVAIAQALQALFECQMWVDKAISNDKADR
jgi:hypothetical protein